jgi:microcystin-dependent protein
MSSPFLGEIKVTAFNFAPKNWVQCNGQLLPINQNQALFSLLGTTYGGDGRVNFGLPDLRSRVAIHMGSGFVLGQVTGQETHTLTTGEMPAHTHPATVDGAVGDGTAFNPNGAYPANAAPTQLYSSSASTTMNAAMVTTAGGSQAHENRQPYLVLEFIIAIQGIFPSQN